SEAVDAEPLAHRVLHLVDVDAIDRAGAGALVAADAGGQVEAVEAPVARLDRHGQLGILEMLREGLALVGLQEIPEGDPHALAHGFDGQTNIAEPGTHEILAVPDWKRPGGGCWFTVDYTASSPARKVCAAGPPPRNFFALPLHASTILEL